MSDEAATQRRPDENAGEARPRRMSIGRLVLFALPFAIFAGLGAFLALRLLDNRTAADVEFERRAAPALDVATLFDDGRLTSETLAATGDVVVVNFWFSECPPCVIEHPALMALSRMEGVTVYGVAVENDPDKSRAFLAQLGDPFAVAGFDAERVSTVEWGVRGFPETFILTPEGEIVYKHTGAIQGDDMERVILPAIEAAREG